MSRKRKKAKKAAKSDIQLGKLIKIAKQNHRCKKLRAVKKAYWFSKEAHADQFRASEDPYFIHPFGTAKILAEIGADCESIAAGLLHDILEDTYVSPAKLKKAFGNRIYSLVEGVTKLSLSKDREKKHSYIATMQKLLNATTADVKVLVIKLADKLDNIRTLHYLPKPAQIRIAKDCLEVYAPLAHKLGISRISTELEDICFRILEPEKYRVFKDAIKTRREKQTKEIKKMIKILSKKTKGKVKPEYEIYTRGIYGSYLKSKSKGGNLDNVHDFAIFDVIPENADNCYAMLGIVHRTFTPVPRKLKDFIARPNQNIYQAVHTTVIGPSGAPVKIYIMSKKMKEIGERGVVALVGEKKAQINKMFSDKFSEINVPKYAFDSLRNGGTFMDALRRDLLDETVFVFNPSGKSFELPVGATALDFGYFVHPDTANQAWKCKINSQMKPLSTKLWAGDRVEIIFSTTLLARKSWLKKVKTHKAKMAVRNFLKQHEVGESSAPLSYDLYILAVDRPGMLADVTTILKKNRINISGVIADSFLHNIGEIILNFDKKYYKKLKKLTSKIKKIKGVKKVRITKP